MAGDNFGDSAHDPVLCSIMSGYGIPSSDNFDAADDGQVRKLYGRRRVQKSASVWDVLADTSSQMDAELRRETEVEREELRLGEWAGVHLAQRLHASCDRLLTFQLSHGDDVDMRVLNVSKHWVRGETTRGEALIPLAAITAVRGLPVRVGEWSRHLVAESSFQMALRAVMPQGNLVVTHEGGSMRGRIVAVGADWVDLLGFASDVGLIENVTNDFLTIPTACIVRVDVPVRAL